MTPNPEMFHSVKNCKDGAEKSKVNGVEGQERWESKEFFLNVLPYCYIFSVCKEEIYI